MNILTKSDIINNDIMQPCKSKQYVSLDELIEYLQAHAEHGTPLTRVASSLKQHYREDLNHAT